MNIFVSDRDPEVAATNLDDKRVIHMAKESIELLAMFLLKYTGIQHILPIVKHQEPLSEMMNHPIFLWVCKDKFNLTWLFYHTAALLDEEVERFGVAGISTKYFKRLRDSIVPYLESHIALYTRLDNNEIKFYNCTYLSGKDVVKNYRKYLIKKWETTDKKTPTWTQSDPPQWYRKNLELFRKES